MEENGKEVIEEVKRALKSPKTLKISRIPANARKAFLDLAYNDFEGDYGMTLKYLIDLSLFWLPRFLEFEIRISNLEKRSGNQQGGDESIVTVGGKKLR